MSLEKTTNAAPVDGDVILPWVCPEHPNAQIRHSWDQTHYVMNGYPVGTGIRSNQRYECAECGRELQPDKE